MLTSSVDFFPGYRVTNCFPSPIEQHKDKNICRLSIELLDTEDTHSEDPVEVEVRRTSYKAIDTFSNKEILFDTKFEDSFQNEFSCKTFHMKMSLI